MSLKSEMAEMKSRLAGLKERIEADDQEAIDQGVQLKADIETKAAEIEAAEKKCAVLKAIGTVTNESEEKSMNEELNLDLETMKKNRGARSFSLKAYNDTHTSVTVNQLDQRVVDPKPELLVRGIFGTENISGNSLTFYTLGAMSGNIGKTNENAKKNQVNIAKDSTTVALEKVTAFIKETDELLSDNAFLDSALRGRLRYEFANAIEAYLVSKLTATSGVQVGESSISFDNILAAKKAVKAQTGYAADCILINPADMETLQKSKDQNGQYILGGPAYGAYGNGSTAENPRIWGLPVVESAEVAEGQCIVGAFKAAASVVGKAGEGQRVEVTNTDADDFEYNRVTVRIEERLALVVRVPAGFVLVGTAASSSSD